jgi:hypothetical protein
MPGRDVGIGILETFAPDIQVPVPGTSRPNSRFSKVGSRVLKTLDRPKIYARIGLSLALYPKEC